MLTSKTLLTIAENDLKASRELYKKNFFPQSIFLFQQSLEKTIKSFAISSGYFKKKEVIKFGHNIIKFYKKLINDQIEDNIFDIFEKIPQLKNTLKNDIKIDKMKDSQKNLKSFLSWIHNEQKEVINIPKEEIEYIINLIYEIKKSILNINQTLENKNMDLIMNEMKSILYEIEETIKEFSLSNNKDLKQNKSIVDEFEKNLRKEDLKEIIMIQMEIFYITQALFYFACIFPSKHASLTRYPTENYIPHELYNENYTLVCYYNELYNILNDLIHRLINLETSKE